MRTGLIASLLVISAAAASAATFPEPDAAGADPGKELFTSSKLGTNGKSCWTCHPGGKRLEWSATYDDAKIQGWVNKCIVSALKGKPLEVNSSEMKAMVNYIKTFGGR